MDSTCRGEGEGLNCKTRKQTHCELHTPRKSANCRARVSSGNYSVGVEYHKQDITAELKAPTSSQWEMMIAKMSSEFWQSHLKTLCGHAVLQVVNIRMNFEAWSVIYFPCWKHTQFHDAINVHITLRCSKCHEKEWVAWDTLFIIIYGYALQVIEVCSQFSLTPICQLTCRINNSPFREKYNLRFCPKL